MCKNISWWYKINRLKINIDKTKVMRIGSKAQLKSWNVDHFIFSYDDTPLKLVENAKYLGMFINCDISWNFHVRRLCQSTYYHKWLLRRLRRIFPMNHLLQVYKSYIQPGLDYGITLYGCSTPKNIDLVQRVQNHAARLIMGNYNYINCRGIDRVKSLNLYTIRERRDYFLTTLMFKAIHGIARTIFRLALICILISMVTTPGKRVEWTFIFLLSTKRYTEIVFYIRVVNFRMNCQIL